MPPVTTAPNPRGASKTTVAGDLTSHVHAHVLQLRDSAGLTPASPFSPTIRGTGTTTDPNDGLKNRSLAFITVNITTELCNTQGLPIPPAAPTLAFVAPLHPAWSVPDP
jgi:hypothetical protein